MRDRGYNKRLNFYLLGVNVFLAILVTQELFSISVLGIIFACLYRFESEKVRNIWFERSITVALSLFLVVILFNGEEPFFLFLDDRNYYFLSEVETQRRLIDLATTFFIERDRDFNNFQYLLSFLFKAAGRFQIVFCFFSLILFIRISSFIYSHCKNSTGFGAVRAFPLELLFFCFVIFKDLILIFFIIEYIRIVKKSNVIQFCCVSLIFLAIAEPLRAGYGFLTVGICLLVKVKKLSKFIRPRLVFPSLFLAYLIASQLISFEIIFEDDVSSKMVYYKQDLIKRLEGSAGILGILNHSLSQGNLLAAIPIILLAVVIPIISIPANATVTEVLFTLVRILSLAQYLFVCYRLSFGGDRFKKEIKLIALLFLACVLIHLLFALGMLRHSLIIMPWIAILLLDSEKK